MEPLRRISPWLLTGDFNAIISDDEHRGGSFRNYFSKASLFSNFIFDNNLIDLSYIGQSFTLCNGQSNLSKLWARLDQYLANPCWISYFKKISNRYLPRTNSDHSPILLTIFSFPHSFNKRVLCFKNFWFDYAGCHDNVVKAYNSLSLASPCILFLILFPKLNIIFLGGELMVFINLIMK